MSGSLLAFAIAAVLEIAGCFTFWAWARRGASPLMVVLGIASLIGFALALTRVDAVFAGRAYAAYGGIYIAASLLWLWLVEGASERMGHARSRDRGDRRNDHPKGEYDVPNAREQKRPATTPAVR